MFRKSMLLSILFTISMCHAIPSYDNLAIKPMSFQSFDRDYLGNKGYFSPMAISPNDVRNEFEDICNMVSGKIDKMGPLLKLFAPFVDNPEDTAPYKDVW